MRGDLSGFGCPNDAQDDLLAKPMHRHIRMYILPYTRNTTSSSTPRMQADHNLQNQIERVDI